MQVTHSQATLRPRVSNPYATDARILACGVSQAPLHAHAFCVGDNLPTARLREALAKRDTLKVMHKAIFDLAWWRKWGFQGAGKNFLYQVCLPLA